MFDEIYVKKDLPLPEEVKNLFDWKNHRFQTKDLDNYLGEYIINEYDELVEVVIERDYIPYTEEEKKDKKLRPWDLWKEVIEKNRSYKVVDYHGVLTFYSYESIDEDTDFWLDFKAYFVYGKLDKIELEEFNKKSGKKEKNKEFLLSIEKEKKNPWNIFKRYARYVGWNKFWRFVEKILYCTIGVLEKIRWFLIRYIH